MAIEHIIFDLDGTLIDPSVAICRSINYALEKNGHKTVEHEDLYPYIGKHLMDPFRDLTACDDEGYLWKLIHSYRERYETIGIGENDLYPGIKDMLRELDTTNYIASIKPAHASKMILKELGVEKHFTGIYGSEIDGTRADKTELLHYLKDQEKIDEAVMVGDRSTDILAAKSCGFSSIAVSYGYGTLAELTETKPNVMVDKPGELKGALLKLCKS